MRAKLTTYRGRPALVPTDDSNLEEWLVLAHQIPGTQPDEDGAVRGSPSALVALMLALGQKPYPSLLYASADEAVLDTLEKREEKLANFQKAGAYFVADTLGRGAFLNDDMGLGKTVQTIAALSAYGSKLAKVVLCPAFLRPQWAAEIQRWTQELAGTPATVQVLWPRSDRRSKKPINPDAEWVVAYYLDAERALELVQTRRYALVVDEIHNLRNVGKARYEALEMASLSAYGRVGLTASELYNDPRGLYPMYNLISPAHWGSRSAFAMRYLGATLNEYGGLQFPEKDEQGAGTGRFTLVNVEELNARRAVHTLRRVKEDVWEQLPFDAKVQVIWLEHDKGAGGELIGTMKGGAEARQTHLERVAMGKVEPVAEQVKSDIAAGLPGLTFTYLKKQALALANAVTGSMLVTGDSTTASKRIELINSYVKRCADAGFAPQVIATMDSLSEGVNAQWAKAVNFAAIDETPDKMRQCLSRSVRMGQVGDIPVRIFGRRFTLDERLVELNREKLAAQFKLAGRKEKGKSDLDDAFRPASLQNSLQEMYERFLRAEKSEG